MVQLQIQALIQLERQIPASFKLNLTDDEIDIKEIKRLLPKKRLAAIANWQGKQVFIKCFYGVSFTKYATREAKGITYFKEAEINTPLLLKKIVDTKQQAVLFIFEYINADAFSTQTRPPSQALEQAIAMIAKMHQRQIIQTDIHLENFLLTDNKTYLIDAGMVQKKYHLSPFQCQYNLALFLMEFSPFIDLSYLSLLDIYHQNNHKIKLTLDALKKEINRLRKKREFHYIYKKVFRNCSAFKVRKTLTQYIAIKRDKESPEIQTLCTNPDAYLAQSHILKSGHSATVGLLEIDHKKYILKRYNRKNWLHFILRSLIPSRAAVSWRNGHLLLSYHLITPTPIALIEQRIGWFRGKSWLLLAYLEGETLMDYFQDHSKQAKSKTFLTKLTQFIHILPTIQVSHGDFKAPNILIQKNQQLCFIDLDGMRSHRTKKTFNQAYLADLKRLERDIGKQLGKHFFIQLKSGIKDENMG